MSFRFLHTSDWQIGKVFRFVNDTTMGLLQDARLQVISRIGELAEEHAAHHVAVAGDVYDMEGLSTRSILQPLERMRRFPKVHWHLLPGNHDRQRPNGLWDQILRKGPPDNVIIHTAFEPVTYEEDSVVFLPAPLFFKKVLKDPTAYMDEVRSPEGYIRIGFAHGTVRGFGDDDEDVPNFISLTARRARISRTSRWETGTVSSASTTDVGTVERRRRIGSR